MVCQNRILRHDLIFAVFICKLPAGVGQSTLSAHVVKVNSFILNRRWIIFFARLNRQYRKRSKRIIGGNRSVRVIRCCLGGVQVICPRKFEGHGNLRCVLKFCIQRRVVRYCFLRKVPRFYAGFILVPADKGNTACLGAGRLGQLITLGDRLILIKFLRVLIGRMIVVKVIFQRISVFPSGIQRCIAAKILRLQVNHRAAEIF